MVVSRAPWPVNPVRVVVDASRCPRTSGLRREFPRPWWEMSAKSLGAIGCPVLVPGGRGETALSSPVAEATGATRASTTGA